MEGFFRPSKELCSKLVAIHKEHARMYLFTSKRVHRVEGAFPLNLVQECIQEFLLRVSGTMWRHAVIDNTEIITKEIILISGNDANEYFLRRTKERFNLPSNEKSDQFLTDLFAEMRKWLKNKGGRYRFLSSDEGHVTLILREENIIFEAHGKMPAPILPPLTQ